MKNCECTSGETNAGLVSINAGQLTSLANMAGERLISASKAAERASKSAGGFAGAGLSTHFHVTGSGDTLATSTFVEGSTGDVVVRGVIAGIPYELHLRVAFEGEQIAVTLHLTKPLEMGPYTWRFELGGLIKDTSGNIVSASSIAPGANFKPVDISWWCAVKCGGAAILPTLIACLPALSGGPAGYIACVTGKLGAGDAAQIAACIAQKCV